MTLDYIQEQASTCTLCSLHKNRLNPVFAKGDEGSNIMICGMVPAHEENKVGMPFVGRAGKLLDDIIKDSAIGDVYITNIVKCCLSPGIPLTKDWISNCIPYLILQIDAIQPKVIITLGADASNGLLGTDGLQMKDLKNNTHNYSKDIKVLPTYHPSYLLRGGGTKHRSYEEVVKLFMLAKETVNET